MVTFANFDSVLRKNEITIRKLDVSAYVFFYSVVSKNVELRLKKKRSELPHTVGVILRYPYIEYNTSA